ncbi:ComF family protein [Ramlibacter aurantiacus]|uniref:ComF family protein n=1 Tax=Ramlibacter aurantiacus TaxID=2801330 RepID=UPI00338F30D2
MILPGGLQVCGSCLREPPELDACHAAVDYAFPWTGLIARFKFQDEPGWARPLADLMRAVPAIAHAVSTADRVVPMPLSRRRLSERGFNQALELARRLGAGCVDARLLLRVRDTLPQASLDLSRRRANVAQAFAVDPLRAACLAGSHVLLVDDVMTSGASLAAAARALRQAGAARVTGVVLARTA